MKAGRVDFGHDELLRRDVRARNVWRKHRKEAVNPGWGTWVVGIFTAVACRPRGLCKVYPGCWKRAWPFVLTRFHSPRFWSLTHLNDDLFHFRCRSLVCYYYYYYFIMRSMLALSAKVGFTYSYRVS